MTSASHDWASAEAAEVYRKLKHGDATVDPAYLRLEEAINDLLRDAMHRIGAVLPTGELDPAAEAIFGETSDVEGQIAQEIAEHVYRSTRTYLEGKRRLIVVH